MWLRRSMCVIAQNFVVVGQTIPEIWRFFDIFKNGDLPPAWICYERVWQPGKSIWWSLSLYKISWESSGPTGLVSIIWKCWYLTSLALKCLFTPPKWRFSGIIPRKWGAALLRSQRAPSWIQTRHTTYRSLRSVQPFLSSSRFYPTSNIILCNGLYTLPQVPLPVHLHPDLI